METNLKRILRAVSLELRHILEGWYDEGGTLHPGDLENRLNQLGLWRDRPPKPLDELRHLSPEDNAARQVVDAYIEFREANGVSREEAVTEFVRESAYTWANRLLTLRCMEARGIIDEVILQKDTYGGKSMVHNRFARKNPQACSGEDDGLFAVLFEEFSERAKELPGLFNPKAPAIALRPSVSALNRCIALLSGRESARGQEPATDAAFEASDALGWAYQYWNAEEKDRVFERVRTKKAKIQGADVIPATQLYTEPYMVKFLVQNSLGALWMGMRPESKLADEWEYYVKDADRAPVKKKPVGEMTFLDPACGSGHFLLEAFDLLYAMVAAEGTLTGPEAICAAILNHNLFGIDIDERAVQITAAALWMKAKEKAFALQADDLHPFRNHLVATNIRLPKGVDHLKAFLQKHPDDQPLGTALGLVFEGLENVHELGSLVQIEGPVEKELRYIKEKEDYERAQHFKKLQGELWDTDPQTVLPTHARSWEDWFQSVQERLKKHFDAEAEAADLAQAFFSQSAGKGLLLFDLLARRYDVVATNPPYMGSKNMGTMLKNYVAKHYPPGKRDLYAAFILRCIELARDSGRAAMVTQQSWMFLRSFADLRAMRAETLDKASKGAFKGLLRETTIETLAHLGPRAFGEISGEVVNIALFTLANVVPAPAHRLTAFRLVGPKSPEEKSELLQVMLDGESNPPPCVTLQKTLCEVFDSPVITGLNEEALRILTTAPKLKTLASTLEGLNTTHNLRFVREFFEVPIWAFRSNGTESRVKPFFVARLSFRDRCQPDFSEVSSARWQPPVGL